MTKIISRKTLQHHVKQAKKMRLCAESPEGHDFKYVQQVSTYTYTPEKECECMMDFYQCTRCGMGLLRNQDEKEGE